MFYLMDNVQLDESRRVKAEQAANLSQTGVESSPRERCVRISFTVVRSSIAVDEHLSSATASI